MYCKKCGTQISDGTQFCPRCGEQQNTSAPQQPRPARTDHQTSTSPKVKSSGTKKNYVLTGLLTVSFVIIAALLLYIFTGHHGAPAAQDHNTLSSLGVPDASTVPENIASSERDTPQAVMEAFCQAIRNQDVAAAVDLFGCELQAQNYNFERVLARAGIWNYQNSRYPGVNTAFTGCNALNMKGTAAAQISNLMFSLNADMEKFGGGMINAGSGSREEMLQWASETSREMASACDIQNLESFHIKELYSCVFTNYAGLNMIATLAANSGIYGSDTLLPCAVLYEYNGNNYLGGVTFVCYGGKWYISSLNAPATGLSSYCYLERTTENEYLQKFKAMFASAAGEMLMTFDEDYNIEAFDTTDIEAFMKRDLGKIVEDAKAAFVKGFPLMVAEGTVEEGFFVNAGITESDISEDWTRLWADTIFYYHTWS